MKIVRGVHKHVAKVLPALDGFRRVWPVDDPTGLDDVHDEIEQGILDRLRAQFVERRLNGEHEYMNAWKGRR